MIAGFACENDTFDAVVYRRLVELELGTSVEPWKHDMVLGGWQSIRAKVSIFLDLAGRAGVERVLVAVDNDGGASRRPAHRNDHDRDAQASTPGGCRWCALETWLPQPAPAGCRPCLVVPVQTIDTWLLVLASHRFSTRTPEATYDRGALKKRLFPPELRAPTSRATWALDLIDRAWTDRRVELLELPSYADFAARIRTWLPAEEPPTAA